MIADLGGRKVLIVAAEVHLETAFHEAFARHGAECVVGKIDQVEESLEALRVAGHALDVLIHGDAPAQPVEAIEDYGEEQLWRAISAGAWPVFRCLRRVKAVLGAYPRHSIALSSPAPDRFAPNADFAAASEAVIETLCRYFSHRLAGEDARLNVIRHRPEPVGEARRFTPDRLIATPSDVANAAVAMCSGLLDSMRGQVLTVDRGGTFCDSVLRLYSDREALGL